MRQRCRACVVLVLGGLALFGCREVRSPIRIEGRQLTVENMTGGDWQNVEIWVNDHYRVTRSRMPAGERLGVPLDAFVAGFGQRFNPAKQVVQGVEVTAVGPGGTPVTVTWGHGRRR